MKKRFLAIITTALVLSLTIAAAALAQTKSVVLKTGSPYMTVNGNNAEIDPGRGTKPIIINGRTLVPIRAIVQEMGGSIAWDGVTREIVIAANGKVIRMYLNDANAEVKSNTDKFWTDKKLDVPPKSINGRTMVPLRFVSEQLGAQVGWNGATKQITISFNAAVFDSKKFTGAWETNEGIIVLIQNGTTLTNAYNNDNLGKLSGTVSGSSFNGKWYVDDVDNGTIKITMSSDGKSFTGNYYIKMTNSKPGLGPNEVTNTFPISGKRQ